MTGRYEVRREMRLSVQVVTVRWLPDGELPVLVLVLAPERAPMLRDALNSYLRGAET